MSSFFAIAASLCCVTLLRPTSLHHRNALRICAALYALCAGLYFARAIYFQFAPPVGDLFSPTAVNVAFLLATLLSVVCCSIGWLLLTYDHLWVDLQAERVRAAFASRESAAAKSEYLEIANHQIRQPLGGILAVTDLLLDSDLTLEQRECTRALVVEAETILRVNENLLICSTVDAGTLQFQLSPFDLRSLLEGVVDYFRESAALIALNLVYPNKLSRRFVGDSDRIRSVILNLVGNAVTRSGAHEIGIIVDVVRLDGRNARIRVAVTRSGNGIAPEELRSLSRSDLSLSIDLRSCGPAEIALAASKMLVHAMGGTVFVEDKVQASVIGFTLSLLTESPCPVS